MSQHKEQKSLLTEDGELRNALEAPVAKTAPTYCIHCGSPNRSEARFCRGCGRSLEDQEIDDDFVQGPAISINTAANHQKAKRSLDHHNHEFRPGPATISPAMAAVDLATLIVMAGLVVWTGNNGSWGLSICVLIAFIAVTLGRHGMLGD